MYLVTIYVGGLYKFREFKELVDDLGGLVLKKDRFSFSRGDYFMTEEVHVLTIIPSEEETEIRLMAKNIKGNLENPKISYAEKKKILSCIPIYDSLSKTNDWINRDKLEKNMSCPCYSPICNEKEEYCFINYLEEVLEGMVSMEMIVERKTSDGKEYKIKKD
jgi:hypothetical protein